MHNVFISYHHKNDQIYKNELVKKFENKIFHDMSVDTGDIDDNLSDQSIRVKIRDEYLRDSSITIVLVGTETKYRKHIDWEIYSSMYNGIKNKQSGILVINLPTVNGSQISITEDDKLILGRDISWSPITSYERYDYLPKRILDNIKTNGVHICVADYDRIITNPEGFRRLLDIAYENRCCNKYDLSERMRRRNG